jgi:membrane-bound metal-dependent hydrolase YbcI (DUF457 family)
MNYISTFDSIFASLFVLLAVVVAGTLIASYIAKKLDKLRAFDRIVVKHRWYIHSLWGVAMVTAAYVSLAGMTTFMLYAAILGLMISLASARWEAYCLSKTTE